MTDDTGVSRVRALSVADACVAARLHAASMTESWDEAAWTGFIADPAIVALCGGDSGILSGVLLIRIVADEAEVLTIAVAEAARSRGLGSELLRAGLAEAANRGAEAAHLEVAVDNDAALALYLKAGFIEIGCRSGYYRRSSGSVDALRMSFALRGAKPVPGSDSGE